MAPGPRARGDPPSLEPAARMLVTRVVAVAALLATAAYLVWRALFTVNLEAWYLAVPMLALEAHAAVGLGLFSFSLWDVDRRPARRPLRRLPRIAVLIPTYNEGPEILVPTLAAAASLEPAHETWLLDDGDRPEIAELAASLGVRYLARPTHEHAKAGNLNHALGVIDPEVIAVLDADHVAAPEFLAATLGYFSDPRVALVQTPQDFYNVTSFEHGSGTTYGQPFHEQTLFYRLLQPGKNRWSAAFWCGTNALVRVSALREIGGVATETITEDIHTTIRLHRRGWKTVYHNEVLARGLAAGDAATYQLQRLRWGTGAMQVLRRENPLFVSGLSLAQRLSYAATLLGWFDAWRSLGYLLLPVAVLVTGAIPIRTDPTTFLAFFAATFGLQQLAMRVLSRGCHRPILSVLFEFVRMTPNLMATLTLVTRRRPTFKVTPKGRTGDGRRPTAEPGLLRWLALLNVAGGAWFALTLMGVTPTRYEVVWAAIAAFAWLVVNVALLIASIRRVRAQRFAGERRSSFRFDTAFRGSIADAACEIRDLSLTGARIVVDRPLPDDARTLVVDMNGGVAQLDAVIRSQRPSIDGRTTVGLEFLQGQHLARARLALGLFHASVGTSEPASDQPLEQAAAA